MARNYSKEEYQKKLQDPEFVLKQRDQQRKRREMLKKNPKLMEEYRKKNRARQKEKMKDPEYRKKIREYNRAYKHIRGYGGAMNKYYRRFLEYRAELEKG